MINLVIAVVASLGIVVFLLVVVVRPDAAPREPIDYASVAAEAQPTVDATLVVPQLPAGWTANRAEIHDDNADGVTTWEIGFLTPSAQYIGMTQGIAADAGWVAAQLQGVRPTGQALYGGLEWTIYDQRAAKDPGNHAYSLVTTTGGSTYLLSGTAPNAEFQTLAESIAAEVTR